MNAANKKRLDKLVAEFQGQEERSQVATIVDNRDAIGILGAWCAIEKDWRPAGKMPRDGLGKWRWLWSCAYYNQEELAALSGLDEKQAARTLRVCVGMRLIYPNGEISTHAQELLEAHGRAKAPGPARGRPPGSKDKKKRKTRGSDDDDE